MRTIIWYFSFFFTLILYIPKFIAVNALKEKLSEEEFALVAEEYTSKWAANMVRLSGARVELSGLENIPAEGAVLFVSNHQSNFDIALFLALIHKPKGFIAKIETTKIPFVASWMRYINCVFMDRTDMKKSAKAILEGIAILKSGHSMVVFPEGTRSRSDGMNEFKAGSFKLCTKTLVPVIPVTISGSYKLMEANGNKIKPADVKMIVHPPLYTENMSKEELAALPDKVAGIIKEALPL